MEVAFSESFKKAYKKCIGKSEFTEEYFTKDKPSKAVFIDIGNHEEVY